jgi:hypothetical protein
MIPIVCKNEQTGIVSYATETTEYQQRVLTAGLRAGRPIEDGLHVIPLNQYTFAALDVTSYPRIDGTQVSEIVSAEFIGKAIDLLHSCIDEQTQGYAQLSHDMQYFAGFVHNLSEVPASESLTVEAALARLRQINDLAIVISAKGSYYRYITEDIESSAPSLTEIIPKLRLLAEGAATFGRNLRRKVNSRSTLPEARTTKYYARTTLNLFHLRSLRTQ